MPLVPQAAPVFPSPGKKRNKLSTRLRSTVKTTVAESADEGETISDLFAFVIPLFIDLRIQRLTWNCHLSETCFQKLQIKPDYTFTAWQRP